MATYEHVIYGSTEDALKDVSAELICAGYMVPDPPSYDPGRMPADPGSTGIWWPTGSVEKAFAVGGP